MMDSSEVCQEVREVTGGWSFMLDELFRRCASTDDPRPFVAGMSKEINDAESELGSELLRRTGLDRQSKPFQVLRTIVECGPVGDADIGTLAGLVEQDSLLPEDCKPAVDFLHRMGCLEKMDGQYNVEPILARIVGRR